MSRSKELQEWTYAGEPLVPAEGFSRRGLAAFEKEATRRSRRDVLIAQGSHERASLHHAFKFDHDATTATATVRGQEET